jgi:hypothetical protein
LIDAGLLECARDQWMVAFPVENRLCGMDRLAKQLNELVRSGRTNDWHHTAIEIGFESAANAFLADKARRDWNSA